MMRRYRQTLLLILVIAACGLLMAAAASKPAPKRPMQGPPWKPVVWAAWELKCLGVNDDAKLKAMFEFPKRRRVSLAVVGQGGVSTKGRLARFFKAGNTATYHDCKDPGRYTHDTGQVEVTLDVTAALGVQVDLHLYQPGSSYSDVARKFREAAKIADVVCLFQSFWGSNAKQITQAIRRSPTALFVSPYVAHGGRPTSETPQGSALKPWVKGSIEHFVLAVPLARRGTKGNIESPLDRGPQDTEAVNFITPSHHSSGGTCPAGGTTAACALYLYAIMPHKPKPAEVVDLLRATSKLDAKIITSMPEFDDKTVEQLRKKIQLLRRPPKGKKRKLDAPGVLNLYDAYLKVAAPNDAKSKATDKQQPGDHDEKREGDTRQGLQDRKD